MLPLMRALFLETNPIPIKAAMAMMGYCRDELRLPLLPMSEAPRAKLRSVMQQSGWCERAWLLVDRPQPAGATLAACIDRRREPGSPSG